MSEQQTSEQNAERQWSQSCLCREILSQLRECLEISPTVRQHLTNSRVEFLKAIRAAIDHRIERVSGASQQGTKIAVE